jgi:HD-like signal output (HDOD) protein
MEQTTTSSTNILKLVNSTVDVPEMPEVLVRLKEATAIPDTSVGDLAKIISADPAVSTNILRIINSAYYGLQARVTSVNLAVSVMGFDMTEKVALQAAVYSAFASRCEKAKNCHPTSFWRHAAYVGVAARALAVKSEFWADTHPEDAYVAGLMHDIGKILLMESSPARYLAMWGRSAHSGQSEVESELEEFGCTHADVGSVLAIKWSMPEDLANAIRYHHDPVRDSLDRHSSSLIHLADQLAWRAQVPSVVGAHLPPLDQDAYDEIGVTPEQVDQLLPRIQDDFAASELAC